MTRICSHHFKFQTGSSAVAVIADRTACSRLF